MCYPSNGHIIFARKWYFSVNLKLFFHMPLNSLQWHTSTFWNVFFLGWFLVHQLDVCVFKKKYSMEKSLSMVAQVYCGIQIHIYWSLYILFYLEQKNNRYASSEICNLLISVLRRSLYIVLFWHKLSCQIDAKPSFHFSRHFFSSFCDQSLSNTVEGGAKWLVNKIKGIIWSPSYLCKSFSLIIHRCLSLPWYLGYLRCGT